MSEDASMILPVRTSGGAQPVGEEPSVEPVTEPSNAPEGGSEETKQPKPKRDNKKRTQEMSSPSDVEGPNNGPNKTHERTKGRHGAKQERQEKRKEREGSTVGEKKKHRRKHRHSNVVKKKHIENPTSGRKHKFKPGVRALFEIRRLQKNTNTQIPRVAVKRILKHIVGNEDNQMRMRSKAVDDVHHMLENYLGSLFQSAQQFAVHSKRLGITEQDIGMAAHFRPESQLVGAFA